MAEFLFLIDKAVFYFVNHSLENVVFDVLMPFVTDLNKNRPAVVLVLLALILWAVKGGRNARIAILLLIPTIALSDQLSSSVIKFLLERPRPCHELSDVRLLVSCGSGYAFPSSHAVNNFAGALVISFFFQRFAWAWFSFAGLVAFSRIYVGVHYPSDVIGGAVIGLVCGGVIIALFTFSEKMLLKRGRKGGSP
ncbi:MAG: phosphatase PAP2 family protein [Ignavibacteriales bacterium]|nr:phosphatase PAP2 family protein [Ignavibacteriales bacterium]